MHLELCLNELRLYSGLSDVEFIYAAPGRDHLDYMLLPHVNDIPSDLLEFGFEYIQGAPYMASPWTPKNPLVPILVEPHSV